MAIKLDKKTDAEGSSKLIFVKLPFLNSISNSSRTIKFNKSQVERNSSIVLHLESSFLFNPFLKKIFQNLPLLTDVQVYFLVPTRHGCLDMVGEATYTPR